jgi:hypothetical protein
MIKIVCFPGQIQKRTAVTWGGVKSVLISVEVLESLIMGLSLIDDGERGLELVRSVRRNGRSSKTSSKCLARNALMVTHSYAWSWKDIQHISWPACERSFVASP